MNAGLLAVGVLITALMTIIVFAIGVNADAESNHTKAWYWFLFGIAVCESIFSLGFLIGRLA